MARVQASIAAMYNMGSLTQKATMSVDSFTGPIGAGKRQWRNSDGRECRKMAKALGASRVPTPEKTVFGYTPRMTELRCRDCGLVQVLHGMPPPQQREDGTFRIEDGLAESVKTLQARWEGMTCEEVRDHLTIIVVMTS